MTDLMVIFPRFPFPLEKGDKLRAFHQLKQLSKHYRVHLICITHSQPNRDALKAVEPFVSSLHVFKLHTNRSYVRMMLALLTGKPFQVHFFYKKAIKKKIHSLIAEINPDHIYCQLVRIADYVKDIHSVPKTLDYMDAFGIGMRRISEDRRFPWSFFYKMESVRMLRYESMIFDYFDHHTIITAQDRMYIRHPENHRIQVVPNGVDITYFQPIESIQKTHDLVFVGNLSYPPNVHSARFIVKEVLPLLNTMGIDVSLLLAGAEPTNEVKSFASHRVTVSGWMDDIRVAYASSRVLLAPMHINTGMQNKLLEGLSMAIPCVTSIKANEAIGAHPGREIMVCSSTKDYCNAIALLLASNTMAENMGNAARDFVTTNYSWEASVSKLEQLMNLSDSEL